MTEEMNSFVEVLVTVQKYFKISAQVFEIINTQSDIEHMAAYLQCAICGIADADILAMSSARFDVDSICAHRTKLLAQMYQKTDELYGTVVQASQMAQELTKKNEEIRELFEKDVREAMQREREANERTISQAQSALHAKDSEIQMLHKQYMAVMEESEKAKKQITGYQNRIQALEIELKNKQTVSAEMQKMQNVHHTGILNKMLRKRRMVKQAHKQSYGYKLFTKNVIQNPSYSEAQKQYLIQCMADGMPYSVLKKFAAPNLSIEMMEQLRRYYEDNVI